MPKVVASTCSMVSPRPFQDLGPSTLLAELARLDLFVSLKTGMRHQMVNRLKGHCGT